METSNYLLITDFGLLISIRGIICGQTVVRHVLISLLESPHGVHFENVYVRNRCNN